MSAQSIEALYSEIDASNFSPEEKATLKSWLQEIATAIQAPDITDDALMAIVDMTIMPPIEMDEQRRYSPPMSTIFNTLFSITDSLANAIMGVEATSGHGWKEEEPEDEGEEHSDGTHDFVGHQAFADFYECEGDLNDEATLKEVVSTAIAAADMDEVSTDGMTFDPQGVTITSIITQSSVTIHTWPEAKGMLVDAITCGPHDPHIIIETLREVYKPKKVNEWKIERGEAANVVEKVEGDEKQEERVEPDVAPQPTRYQPVGEVKGQGVEVRECPHGHGVFATQDFEQDVTIASFVGNIVDEEPEGESVLRVDSQFWLKPKTESGEEWANYLDHSDEPNARFMNFNLEAGSADLVSIKPIKSDEEVLIDYGKLNV